MVRTRKKKPVEDLKTEYYYRQGILKIEFCDNSRLGLYAGEYVFIKKYCKEREQFLVEDRDGEKFWTDMIVPIRPTIEGHELYYTSFELLVERDYKNGDQVCYRTRNGFSSLRKEIRPCECYQMFTENGLNLENVPKSFNFALGYSDGISIQSEVDDSYSSPSITNNKSRYEE